MLKEKHEKEKFGKNNNKKKWRKILEETCYKNLQNKINYNSWLNKKSV